MFLQSAIRKYIKNNIDSSRKKCNFNLLTNNKKRKGYNMFQKKKKKRKQSSVLYVDATNKSPDRALSDPTLVYPAECPNKSLLDRVSLCSPKAGALEPSFVI